MCRAFHPHLEGEAALAKTPCWTIEALQQALYEFKDRYNKRWLIEGHGQRTAEPVQARGGGRGAVDETRAAA